MASKKQTVKAARRESARYTNGGASTAELSQDALITRHLRRTTEQRYRDENQNQNST